MIAETLRRTARYTWILCLIAAIHTGTVMYSRWRAVRDAERAANQARADRDRRVLDAIGTGIRILTFYASPGSIRRGEKTLLCYGVGNAKTVALSPPVDTVWPSNSRCMEVSPKATTTYTLTASDENGRSVSQETVVEVRLN